MSHHEAGGVKRGIVDRPGEFAWVHEAVPADEDDGEEENIVKIVGVAKIAS